MGKNFFCNKTKLEDFLENHGHNFLDIEKKISKNEISDKSYLGQLELLEVSRAFQNWAQLGSNLHDKYLIAFYEKYSGTIFGV